MYGCGKTTSTIARDVNRPTSTVNTIVKNKVRIVETIKGAVTLKNTAIIMKRLGPVSEMEKLLTHTIKNLTQERIPLSF